MKTMNFEQMEVVNGGRKTAAETNWCLLYSGAGLLSGVVGASIAVLSGPVGWGAMAMICIGLASGTASLGSC